MPTCSAFRCSYKHVNKSNGKSIHKFPFSRPEIVKMWVHNVGRKGWTPSTRSVLCSDHFEKYCFLTDGKSVCLKKDAVPTIFQPTKNKNAFIWMPNSVPIKTSHKKLLTELPKNIAMDNSLLIERPMDTAKSESVTTSPYIIKYNVGTELPAVMDSSVIKCEEASANKLSTQFCKIQDIRSLNSQVTLQSTATDDKLISSHVTCPLRISDTIGNCEKILTKIPRAPILKENIQSLNSLYVFPTSNSNPETSLDNNVLVSKKKFQRSDIQISKHKKTLKMKQQKINRLIKTVHKMQERIDRLEFKTSLRTLLKERCSEFHLDFIFRMLAAKKGARQNCGESIREFAIAMYTISPRAYKYVRSQFKNSFPHRSQVREWIASERDRSLSVKNECYLQVSDELQSKDNTIDMKGVDNLQSEDDNIKRIDKMQSEADDNNINSTDDFQATGNCIVNDTEEERVIVQYITDSCGELHRGNNYISYNSIEIQSAVQYIDAQESHSETNAL